MPQAPALPSPVKPCEAWIEKLEREKIRLADIIADADQTADTFEEMFELAMRFPASPWKLCASDLVQNKRTVLRLAVKARTAYHRGEGIRTPKTHWPFKVLRGLTTGRRRMVHRGCAMHASGMIREAPDIASNAGC